MITIFSSARLDIFCIVNQKITLYYFYRIICQVDYANKLEANGEGDWAVESGYNECLFNH